MLYWIIFICATLLIAFVVHKFVLSKPKEIKKELAKPSIPSKNYATRTVSPVISKGPPSRVSSRSSTEEPTSSSSGSETTVDTSETEDKSYITFDSETEYSEVPELTDDQKLKTAPLTPRDLKLFTLKSQTIELQAGEILLREGEPNSDIFQHLSGKLAVQKNG